MKRIILLIVLGIVFGGCATINPYRETYNEAIRKETSTTIIKEGDTKEIHPYVTKYLESLGYKRVLYSDLKQGFMVVFKDIHIAKSFLVGDPHMYRIILKYTKAGEGKTRIDLVNATSIFWAIKDVDKDIQQIAQLIKNE